MNKYFITRVTTKNNHAGSKAVNDTDLIMENCGYKRITIFPAIAGNPIIRKMKNMLSLNNLNAIEKDSLVIVEHPLYINPVYIKRIKRLKTAKRLKLVFLIHDFETERKLFLDSSRIPDVEKCILEICDGMIVHNEVMAKVLMEKYHVANNKLFVLGLFDYLCSERRNDTGVATTEDEVAIAGNLNPTKSGYVYKVAKACPNVKFALYGVNFEGIDGCDNYKYYGSVDADALPNELNGKYGLVWDGPEIDSCSGVTGNYLRINNPHKVSLYVAAGLPIIVWSESAAARFVENNRIGFAIKSLSELEGKINSIDSDEYSQYKLNLSLLSSKVRSGGYLKAVLDHIESAM